MKRSPSTLVVTVAGLMALVLVAAACGSAKSSTTAGQKPSGATVTTTGDVIVKTAGAPKYGGSLVYAVEGESDGWNPTSARWTEPALTEAGTVFDPLAAWGPNYDAEPYLAQSFTHSADYTTWDIKLRSGITFADGEPLNSAALKTDLDAIKASALTSSSFGPVVSTSIVDDLTLAVHMSIPWSVFPATLTSQVGFIAAPKQIHSGDTLHPIGTGPFLFSSWTQNSSFVVRKNPSYWRKGLPYLDQVTFKPITEDNTMYDALTVGDVDVMETSSGIIQPKMQEAADNHQIQVIHSSGETEENNVMFNTQAAPLNDLNVRQALVYAFDAVGWTRTIGISSDRLANGPFAPGSKWYVPTGYPTYDLAKANALVAQYKSQHGGAAPNFTLNCTNTTTALQTCQVLQRDWSKIGIHVDIRTFDEATLISNAISGSYQATIWRQFGAQDPDMDSVWWNGANTKPPLALNMARNVDPKIDAALYVGRTSHIKEERQLAYITLATQLAKDLPYLWLDHTVWMVGARNNVRGWDATTLPNGEHTDAVLSGVQRLTQIWLAS
jgi:ABC-type transport system substrate-binding protein